MLGACTQRLEDAGLTRVPLPPRSPGLQAFAERWRQAVQTAGLSRLILGGERSLRPGLSAYVAPHHAERPQQGKGPVILLPSAQEVPDSDAPVACGERRGGLLKYYHRQAA